MALQRPSRQRDPWSARLMVEAIIAELIEIEAMLTDDRLIDAGSFVTLLARQFCPPKLFTGMQTACPKCKTIVRVTGPEWSILNGSCPELIGTKWHGKPECCPVLTVVASPDVVLPGAAIRAAVQDEINSSKVVSLSEQKL